MEIGTPPGDIAAVCRHTLDSLVDTTVARLSHDKLLDVAVKRLARDTVTSYVRKRNRASHIGIPATVTVKPISIRVSNGDDHVEPSLKSGFRRCGLLPRVLQIVDQTALIQSGPSQDVVRSGYCHSCDAICPNDISRFCMGGCRSAIHQSCAPDHTADWFCDRWRCQLRYRSQQIPNTAALSPPSAIVENPPATAPVIPKPEPPRKRSAAPPPKLIEYPGTKAWRTIDTFFDPLPENEIDSLLDSAPLSSNLYDVPAPEYCYREIWEAEDKLIDSNSNDLTPRSVRYRQRIDTTEEEGGAPGDTHSNTSGRVARVSFYLKVGAKTLMDQCLRDASSVPARFHWDFRSLDLKYAVGAGLISSDEKAACGDLPYMFPPPLYEPLSARFYLFDAPSPFDRPANPVEAVNVEAVAGEDEVDPLQEFEDDDEICCELWLLRRHLEEQIKQNGDVKSRLRDCVAADRDLYSSMQEKFRDKKTILNAYARRYLSEDAIISENPVHEEPPRPVPVPRPPASPSRISPPLSPPIIEVTDIDFALAAAGERHVREVEMEQERERLRRLPPPSPTLTHHSHLNHVVTVADMCRLMAERHVLMSKPPTLATIVDFITTDLVLEDQVMATSTAELHVERYRQQRQLRLNQAEHEPDQLIVEEVMKDLLDSVQRERRLEIHQERLDQWRKESVSMLSRAPLPNQRSLPQNGLAAHVVDKKTSVRPVQAELVTADAKLSKLVKRHEYIVNDNVQFCFCKRPDDLSRWFISCDICENWYHGSCVGFNDDLTDMIAHFICPSCVRRSRRRTVMKQSYLAYLFDLSENLVRAKSVRAQVRMQKERDAVTTLSSLKIRLRKRPRLEGEADNIQHREVSGVFLDDGISIDITDPLLLPEGIPLISEVPVEPEPPEPVVDPFASTVVTPSGSPRTSTGATPGERRQRKSRLDMAPLRRSQREAAQWATTLNCMRDVDVDRSLDGLSSRKRRRSSHGEHRVITRTADGVTLSANGIRLGRPRKRPPSPVADDSSPKRQRVDLVS
uniref:PHD-type domain-containing protein n=1 Tax=Spongospora subterranea TaxID=70186 RepID=A0A0H5RNI3_9EUKA|eukprot:CRZ10279.1 hypothetical protein [Spongospora subterranea]